MPDSEITVPHRENEEFRDQKVDGSRRVEFELPHLLPPQGKISDSLNQIRQFYADRQPAERRSPDSRPKPGWKKATAKRAFNPTEEQRSMVRKMHADGLPYRSMLVRLLNHRGFPISLSTFLRHFGDEIGYRPGRLGKGIKRERILPKQKGWVALRGAKLSYKDCIDILLSSSTDATLADLYGVLPNEIGKVRRGQLRAMQHMMPSLAINMEADDPLTIRRRFQVQKRLMRELIDEMEKLVEEFTRRKLIEQGGAVTVRSEADAEAD